MTIKIDIGKGKAQGFSDAVLNAMLNKVRKGVVINTRVLEEKLTRVVRNSYLKAVRFATNGLIGASSPKGAMATKTFAPTAFENAGGLSQYQTGKTMGGRLSWRALGYATMKDKGSDKFFIKGGDLKTKLAANAANIVDKTGIVKVVATGGQQLRDARGRFTSAKKVEVGNIRIRIMPNITPNLLPGLKSNNIGVNDVTQAFEKRVVGDSDIEKKLMGPTDHRRQRPLLQPVFAFWTRYYIPNEINKELRKMTYDKDL